MSDGNGFQRLEIVGTTHVDRASIVRVRDTIDRIHPSVVAIELCEERLWAIGDPTRGKLSSPTGMGLLPWLIALLEKTVGDVTEVFPGTEMMEAVDAARNAGSRVFLIDKPIRQILNDIRRVPFLEKLRIGADVVIALFAVQTKCRGFEILKPTFEQLMTEFEKKYPTLSRILVEDRDRYMADRLQEILNSTSGRVVAIVGFGHVRGISRILRLVEKGVPAKEEGLRYDWTIEGFSAGTSL